MKKCFVVIVTLFCVLTLRPMELIQKVYDWRDDRNVNHFMHDFGLKTCTDMTTEVNDLSWNTKKKIVNKGAEKYPQLPKKRELLSSAVILAVLPYEMQKEILQKIDTIFVDDKMVKEFLEMPFKEALCWSACINKKMGDKQSYIFKKRKLFGEKFKYELTRAQMFNVSFDEVIMLDTIKDHSSFSNKLELNRRTQFNKKELITLHQLIQKGHIVNVKEVERKVDIVVDTPWDYPLKLLKKSAVSIILPLFTSYYAQQILVSIDPLINSQKRITNSALDRLEMLGEGPYLRHELHEHMYPSGTIFKYFLIKLSDLAAFGFIHLVSPLQIDIKDGVVPYIIRSSGYSVLLPFCVSVMSVAVWARSLFSVVNVSEFKTSPLVQLVVSIIFFVLDECWELLLTDKKDLDVIKNKTIHYDEIPHYLDNRWIVIK